MQTNTRERGQTQRIKKVRAVRTVLGGDCIQVAPKGAFAKADECDESCFWPFDPCSLGHLLVTHVFLAWAAVEYK